MNQRILFFALLLMLGAWLPGVQAQTVDASFQATTLYKPSSALSVMQQADGKYLAAGAFLRNATGPIGRVVRYNPDFTPDAAFNTALTGLTGAVYSARALPGGQVLVVGNGPLTLGGTTREDLLRVNNDGTPDPTFDAGTASGAGTASLVELLPGGQLLVGGTFTTYNGVARSRLVRLTATGSVDAGFVPPAFSNTVVRVAVQPDAKALVMTQTSLRRLNTDGSTDTGFAIASSSSSSWSGLALQPDGKVVVGGYALPFANNTQMARLLTNGNVDATFSLSSRIGFADYGTGTTVDNRWILIQADGRIVIRQTDGVPARLNANGSTDASFQSSLSLRTRANWLAATASGQVLVAGIGFELPGHRSGLALLNANGSWDNRFSPVLLNNGYVDAVAVQPDGMVLAAGAFDEANGTLVNNLVRFRTDGTLDPGFVPPPFMLIRQLLLQPDGKVMVMQYHRTSQPTIVRLLPNGAPDTGFQVPGSVNYALQVLSQPDGKLLALVDTGGINNAIIRLATDGRIDRTFTAALNPLLDNARSAALQPDGKVVVAGYYFPNTFSTSQSLRRLLPNGQADASFAPLLVADAPEVTSVHLQPDGKLLLVDNFYGRLRRFLSNGGPDATFTSAFPNNGLPFININAVQVQPNGFVLVAGTTPNVLVRLRPDGSIDPFFTNPGIDNVINGIAITATGQIVVGGYFLNAGGQPRTGLVRLNAANVLRVADKQVAATTEAWPNPSHGKLQLSLQESAHPQRITLFSVLGEAVLTQPVNHPELTLNTASLAPGVYVLRVDYAAGFVTRRVVLE